MLIQACTFRIDWNVDWLTVHESSTREGFWNLQTVPTVDGPGRRVRDRKRKQRIAGFLCEENSAFFRNMPRAARSVATRIRTAPDLKSFRAFNR